MVLTKQISIKSMTYNGPEYFVGSGATIDLFILLMSACISYVNRHKMA